MDHTTPQAVRIAHILHGCRTLGPGIRVVVWVAGCDRGCPGCVAAPINGARAGRWLEIDALYAAIFRDGPPAGLTLSGGEPFEQAGALAELCRRIRRDTDLSILAYTGHRYEQLAAVPSAAALLAELDLLVDGPFLAARQAGLRWRGSSNQRILLLSPRHRDDPWRDTPDAGAGVEVHITPAGRVFWAGVPPPGFVERTSATLRARGLVLHPDEEPWA